MTSTETMGIMNMAKRMGAEADTKRMVMRKVSHTDITEKRAITRDTDTTEKKVITRDTNIRRDTDITDVAVIGSMRERGIAETEKVDSFRSILMPREPRGCMRGCENADTTCFIGRGHTSDRNAC
nr:hypothetical protein [uncultured Stomatobaculum sp.]